MIRRHKWMHARGYAFAGAIDATSGRYVPDESEILTKNPKPGTFYRGRTGITLATIAEVAYGKKYTHTGLMLMNGSTWNDHVRRSTKGWESYHVAGLQSEPKYGSNPRSTYGSGTAYPVIWVPPLDKREPEAVIVSPAPAPGVPAPPPLPPIGPGGLPPPWTQPIPPGGGGGSAAPIPKPPSGGGYVAGRYVPTASQILTKNPKPGTFYRGRTGITLATIAEVAYGKKYTHTGLMLMNGSTWNDHVRRSTKGWESYHVAGLQSEPKYGAHPSSFFGTGNAFPVFWIPPVDGREPEAFYGAPSPVPPVGPVVPPVGPVVPPYVPPYVPPVGPVEPPVGPVVPPVGPVEPPVGPVVPPYVPPVVPIVPPVPPSPPPVPPYIPPPSPPISAGSGALGGAIAGVTVIAAIARLLER